MSVFNLEEYISLIYRNIWSDIYNHIQDVLFFTRAELYPVDLSTKDMLTLQLNWLTIDTVATPGVHHPLRFHFSITNGSSNFKN